MAVPQTISIEDGYRAMFEFLNAYWERGGKASDDIAILLGAMALSDDGISVDLAMPSDWGAAVLKVTGEIRA